MQARPNSTTLTPRRDIDYILTYGIKAELISTLGPHSPAHFDHLGIIIDFDLSLHFSSTFSDMNSVTPRLLTSGINSSVSKYIDYNTNQVINHKLDTKICQLLSELNMIDSMLTDIMLAGDCQSSPKCIQRQHWTPKQRMIARTFSYWKQKASIIDPIFIHKKKQEAHNKWRSCKKHSEEIRLQFLKDKAELMALELRTPEEKALKAIIKSEASR